MDVATGNPGARSQPLPDAALRTHSPTQTQAGPNLWAMSHTTDSRGPPASWPNGAIIEIIVDGKLLFVFEIGMIDYKLPNKIVGMDRIGNAQLCSDFLPQR